MLVQCKLKLSFRREDGKEKKKDGSSQALRRVWRGVWGHVLPVAFFMGTECKPP